jgi:hypothetical protein
MDDPTSPPQPARALRLRAVGLVALALGTACLGRTLVVLGALAAASGWAEHLASLAIAPTQEPEDELEAEGSEEALAGPLRLDEAEELAAPSAEGTSSSHTTRSTWGAPRSVSVRASAAQVLGWANAGVVPRGSPVPARGPCPAGIKLRGVGVYGLGLEDGDVLVRVEGVPVTDRSQVVSTVLGGRGRMKPTLDALVVRPRTGCRLSFQVVLEQPYPTEEQLRRALPPETEGASEGPDRALTPPALPLERALSNAPR